MLKFQKEELLEVLRDFRDNNQWSFDENYYSFQDGMTEWEDRVKSFEDRVNEIIEIVSA